MISDVPKKTAIPENETNEYRPNDSGKFLAQWLKESARRTRQRASSDPQRAPQPVASALPAAQESAFQSLLGRAKWPLIAVLVAVAYLQYFYVDVMVQIAALPAIIFFILINGQMPPV